MKDIAQVGELASRFSELEEACHTPKKADGLLGEIESFIKESLSAGGSAKTKEILEDLQTRVATWHLVWPRLGGDPQFRNAVAREAHAWAQKLLKFTKPTRG